MRSHHTVTLLYWAKFLLLREDWPTPPPMESFRYMDN